MRLFIPLIFFLTVLLASPHVAMCGAPLPTDPMEIRKELRTLRKKAADNDPLVRARIDQLLKQLQKLQGERDAAESRARGEERPDEEGDNAIMTREKTWEQTAKIAADGKGAKIDLAEPVRKQISDEYEEDRDKSIKNPAIYKELTLLIIDLSRKEAPALIELLDKFTSIKTLILTGGVHGAPVNLPYILNKAKKLPLTELYIFNFGGYLSSIPESIGVFSSLNKLSMFNNSITRLPTAVGTMKQLTVLHVDINPIATLLPTVKGLTGLTELGVGKTNISTAELGQLATLLPGCRIMTK